MARGGPRNRPPATRAWAPALNRNHWIDHESSDSNVKLVSRVGSTPSWWLLLLEHSLDVGQLALIRDDIDPGDQVVGHAQREHGNHSTLEERDDARLAIDHLRHELVARPGAEEPHNPPGDRLAANVRLADRRQRSAHVGPTHDRRVE